MIVLVKVKVISLQMIICHNFKLPNEMNVYRKESFSFRSILINGITNKKKICYIILNDLTIENY